MWLSIRPPRKSAILSSFFDSISLSRSVAISYSVMGCLPQALSARHVVCFCHSNVTIDVCSIGLGTNELSQADSTVWSDTRDFPERFLFSAALNAAPAMTNDFGSKVTKSQSDAHCTDRGPTACLAAAKRVVN
jgi:hypothetical protein